MIKIKNLEDLKFDSFKIFTNYFTYNNMDSVVDKKKYSPLYFKFKNNTLTKNMNPFKKISYQFQKIDGIM